jgi:hypothetical protein
MIKLFKKEHGLKHLYIISDEDALLEQLNPKKIWIKDGSFWHEEQRMSA